MRRLIQPPPLLNCTHQRCHYYFRRHIAKGITASIPQPPFCTSVEVRFCFLLPVVGERIQKGLPVELRLRVVTLQLFFITHRSIEIEAWYAEQRFEQPCLGSVHINECYQGKWTARTPPDGWRAFL